MNLILLRHGKAPTLAEAKVARDADRPLSDVGRRQAKKAGEALAELDCRPTLILASPLLRARETAEQSLKGLRGESRLKIFEPLGSGADPRELLAALAPHAGEKTLMLVGHEPDLGAFASLVLFGSEASAIALKPGGMLLIETEGLGARRSAYLRWLLLPSQVEALV